MKLAHPRDLMSWRYIYVVMTLLALVSLFDGPAAAQQPGDACPRPSALMPDAFNQPMTFSPATSKGNSNTSAWIAATGRIVPDTPTQFRAFLLEQGVPFDQVVLHSPGGNLAAGLELGRILREHQLTTNIGRTERNIESYSTPCDTWYDTVVSGICASSCAYAFLGGEVRFVQSPYYQTEQSLLGFHQFYGGPERGGEMLTAEQVAEIEASTVSIAQALTGQIVLYAIEMGIDPRVVAFASATPGDDLYFPTQNEIASLSIASGSGLGAWFMEPYSDGLVTAAKPNRTDSLLEQVTAYCGKSVEIPSFLIKMDLVTPSYPNVADLPLSAVEMLIDGTLHVVSRSALSVRYGDGSIFITVPVPALSAKITQAKSIEFGLDAPRVMGWFREEAELDDFARQSLSLAWRNCI